MEEIQLEVQIRNEVGRRKIKQVRRKDFVPAVLYGGKEKSAPIKVNRVSYERIMKEHKGQSVLFHLNVMDGGKKLKDYPAIVKEEQHHPVTSGLTHIDFNRISLTEEIEVKVPIEVKGEPVGVKQDGGSLDHHLWELDVVCLPLNIPDKIVVEVSALKIGDAVLVKQIKLPEGVRTKHDPEGIIVTVVPPMKEESAAAVVEGAPTEPEVLKEKKKEEVPAGEEKAEAKKDDKAKEKTK